MGKLRHQEVKLPSQGHIAWRLPSKDRTQAIWVRSLCSRLLVFEGSLCGLQSHSAKVCLGPGTGTQAAENFATKAKASKPLWTGPKGETVKPGAVWNGKADTCGSCLPTIHSFLPCSRASSEDTSPPYSVPSRRDCQTRWPSVLCQGMDTRPTQSKPEALSR